MSNVADGRAIPDSGWAVEHSPAANTIATVTKTAPGPGKYHVVTAITVTARAGAATAILAKATLSGNGATGVNWSARVGVAAVIGETCVIAIPGAWRFAANEAVTLALDTIPGASNFETVAMTGFVADVL